MLVYLNNDMGYTSISGKRIYGKKYAYGSMGPTEITQELYEKYISILCEAEYNSRWIKKRYNVDLPDISFKLSELNKIDFNSLVKIAIAIGIKYHKGKNKPNRAQLMALRRSVVLKFNKDAQ